MSRLVDIKSEKFWDVLFDEACVEGSQAERIENVLNKIAVSEQEIRNKAIDEFASELINHAISADIGKGNEVKMEWVSPVTRIKEIAEQMKDGVV